MNLEQVLSNLRAVPDDKKEQLVEAVMGYFPILVNLLDDATWQLFEDWSVYLRPSADSWAEKHYEQDDVERLDADIERLIDQCIQMDGLLMEMFRGLGVTPSTA